MAHKSPFTKEIYEVWEKLAFGAGSKLLVGQRVKNLHPDFDG
ncbi:MAG: hypothetical protein WCI55_01110 [Armatimonadota bacterium]